MENKIINNFNTRKTLLRIIRHKTNRLFLKIASYFKNNDSPKPIKSIPLSKLNDSKAQEFGRKRDYIRAGDGSGPLLIAVKNRKTGTTMVIPYSISSSLYGSSEDWEVMENICKE